MHIPRYWARSDAPVPASSWRWSDISVEDALRRANEQAQKIAKIFASGSVPDQYAYGDRPIREEVVRRVTGGDGTELAIVTRNLYGALVLNAAGAMFIDIDLPSPKGWRSLFRRGSDGDAERASLERVKKWAEHQRVGIHVYRTAAGLRGLVTSRTYEPTTEATIESLRHLGSDPLYIRLCAAQQCFRARLTPKPWRCGSPCPPSRYPWQSPEAEMRFRAWEAQYEAKTSPYAVCRLVAQIGPKDVHPAIHPIIELHDQHSCSDSKNRLA